MAISSRCLFYIFIVVLEVYSHQKQTYTINQVIDESGGLQWDNCGIPNTPMIVESFRVYTYPVIIGRTLRVSASVNVTQDIGLNGQHLMLDGSVKIKIGDKYMEVCDLLGDYCQMKDICSYLENHNTSICPPFTKKGGYCKCPILAGRYEANNISIPLPKPGFEIHGSFELAIAIKDDTSFQGCIKFKFCVNRCSP